MFGVENEVLETKTVENQRFYRWNILQKYVCRI